MRPRHVSALVLIALGFGTLAWMGGDGASAPEKPDPRPLPVSQGGGNGAVLARLYPANSATRYARIVPVADGFAPPDMQAGLNTPGSRWRNPAKTVQPVFPRTFNNPVRVRSGVADVSAVPVNANPDSIAQIGTDGSLTYANAFGPGIDVVYRCEALKTEEIIVIREPIVVTTSVVSPLAATREQHGTTKVVTTMAGDSVVPTGLGAHNRSAPSTEVLGYSQSVPTGRTKRTAVAISFSWDLQLGPAEQALKARLTPANTIELCDEKGVPRLRINAPEGKDASGKLLRAGKELCITLEGNRVTLAAEVKGLEFPVVIDPTWSSTGSLAIIRGDEFTATLLQDGNVLVVGGINYTNDISKLCELFDKVSRTWSNVGNLNSSHRFHTATLLGDGKVLVVGDEGSSNVCELYDPLAKTWSLAAPLAVGRYAHTATYVSDGTVIVAGGVGSGGPTATCELYQPSGNSWTTKSPMAAVRNLHTSVEISPGKVLVVGGVDATNAVATCEVFDVSGNSWSATGNLNFAR